MSELYIQMCNDSPVQKEWKQKSGDRIFNLNRGCIQVLSEPLHLGQIFYYPDYYSDGKPALLEISKSMITNRFYDGIESMKYVTNDELTWLPTQEQWQEIYVEEKHVSYSIWDWTPWDELSSEDKLMLKRFDASMTIDNLWTIIWCLFVHKEVYGLTWDWEKNKWK